MTLVLNRHAGLQSIGFLVTSKPWANQCKRRKVQQQLVLAWALAPVAASLTGVHFMSRTGELSCWNIMTHREYLERLWSSEAWTHPRHRIQHRHLHHTDRTNVVYVWTGSLLNDLLSRCHSITRLLQTQMTPFCIERGHEMKNSALLTRLVVCLKGFS